jgi:hypothetical protein
MADLDELLPDFDGEEGEAGEGRMAAEEGQNRAFLIGAIILASVFVVGIALIALFLFRGGGRGPAVSDTELTNQANMTLYAATQTSQFQTETAPTPAPATSVPTRRPATDVPTAVATEPGTEVAEITPQPTTEGPAPTSLVDQTAQPTSGLIEATPLGGGTPQPTAPGGAVGPTSQPGALPDTGFTGGPGLAGAGLLAVVLVALVAAVRRIRLSK